MATITPTVTAENAHQYRGQVEKLAQFAKRIHIDLMDGEFAPSRSISVNQIFWSDEFEQVDVHLMYRSPGEFIDGLIKQQPDLIILHAESDGDIAEIIPKIKRAGIKAGVSLLANSQVADFSELIEAADHALIFSGKLGYFGGTVDVRLLEKVGQLKAINPKLEIGWDGGIDQQNAVELVANGIDVLNVGGFIQRSEDPAFNFELLQKAISDQAALGT